MLLGTLWSWTISLKNKFAKLVASLVLWQDIKYVILKNLFTTIKIESLPFFYIDKPSVKSINILIQGSLGTSK